MKKSRLYGAVCAFVFSLISIPSHAALVDNGDGLIYDTVLDITWAQNRAQTTLSWDEAKTYASELRLGGVGGWRLPYISVTAGAGPFINQPVNCAVSTEEACRDNEMGYMFYYNLGGTEGQSILESGDPDLALFPTLNPFAPYWTGTEAGSGRVWNFNFDGGTFEDNNVPDELYHAWAVHEGNVGRQPQDISTVAAEGDTLPDTTVLQAILIDGGVAISTSGQVAFGGRTGDGIDAAFTQNGLIVAEGDTLPDETVFWSFRPEGQLDITDTQLGDLAVFHGRDADGTVAVFSQAGFVATEGAILSNGRTLEEIEAIGKVAANAFGDVAFHGRYEVSDGLIDESVRAVLTQLAGETNPTVIAEEGGLLLDETTQVEEIEESGGVDMNLMGVVAFHGRVVESDAGIDTIKAVFTQNSLVAREGTILEDETVLDDINEDGGVAINLFGDVVFHGHAVSPTEGSDTIKGVFTQSGLIVAEGDTLSDGETVVDEINVSGGVGVNFAGQVVFHGRTGGVEAVFTQHGVVAKVGDNVSGGNTLDEINENAGVAINDVGAVAFHGKIGNSTVDAVFVGQAPTAEE